MAQQAGSSGTLDNKVIVVSGIGPGLGQSLAHACAVAGASVVVSARTPRRVAELEAVLVDAGHDVLGVVSDVTVSDSRQKLIDATIERFGRIDGLINNAFSMGPMATSDQIGADEWRAVFEVNVIGTVALTTLAAERMQAVGGGAIVMIGSQAARRGAPRRGPYAASKAALLSAAQVLASEYGPAGIRVNSVVPGQIWGESLADHYAAMAERQGRTTEEVEARVTKDIPLRRFVQPEEIAAAAVFLMSDAASAITGQALDVNGGNWFH